MYPSSNPNRQEVEINLSQLHPELLPIALGVFSGIARLLSENGIEKPEGLSTAPTAVKVEVGRIIEQGNGRLREAGTVIGDDTIARLTFLTAAQKVYELMDTNRAI